MELPEPANQNRPDLAQLAATQAELARQIRIEPPPAPIRFIAGCDSAFLDETQILSVIAVLSFPELEEVEVRHSVSAVPLPYIPGFLAFREIPNLLNAFALVEQLPDLLMVDGHGISHPRRLGIASHLGVLLDLPSIGVAKKKLVGKYEEPAPTVGSQSPVIHKGEVVAMALRAKRNTNPLFISVGHRFTLEAAVKLTEACLRKFKLPEPTRVADAYSKSLKKNYR